MVWGLPQTQTAPTFLVLAFPTCYQRRYAWLKRYHQKLYFDGLTAVRHDECA